ncbi:nuclear transport factor 2 family protein [Dyella sp. 2HG41-7]|uniref:nuclear transport factor 2 family protein n=1 Tax=Dyella sp. 2HG41-7 TaxID=2883239 RepID=UPI001F3A24C3|nr:nuclear transport factor 2 family protein [Dyella sp. 2HG41-7]
MRTKVLSIGPGFLGLFFLLLTAIAAAADTGKDSSADILAVRNVEIAFHQAGSWLPKPDLDSMMGLYADDAVLTDTAHGNKTYAGKDQVRAYFANVAAPFQPNNHWIGYTPAMRIKAAVDGDKATLYFECLWMDIDKNAIGSHSFSDMTLERMGDKWLIKTIKVGKVNKL